MTAEWGGKHTGKTLHLGNFSRVSAQIYDSGTQNFLPEIQIIETYPPRLDGVTEHGGRLITSIPFVDLKQARAFQAEFEKALSGMLSNEKVISAGPGVRDRIARLAHATHRTLSQG
ncbi:MAG: hypothetical protein J0L77_05200 [Alphaproteobacteria bacterium]|nr:hypothetical protein [Alphaproteobacteria bacterium]